MEELQWEIKANTTVHSVLTANTSQEAIEQFRNNWDAKDLKIDSRSWECEAIPLISNSESKCLERLSSIAKDWGYIIDTIEITKTK